ncbi:MAG: ACT domain-containing protein [Proteobacteria bacterium]|nr:ACT domain-containing protein [Pseudomonadota bacterium]
MAGIRELETLLQEMSPRLHDGEYCFMSLAEAGYGDLSFLNPIACMQEREGLTLVVPCSMALQHGYSCETSFCCITLEVHSSLNALGLTAAVSQKLAEQGISANVIAGFYHDHLFVPAGHGNLAMQVLTGMGKV